MSVRKKWKPIRSTLSTVSIRPWRVKWGDPPRWEVLRGLIEKHGWTRGAELGVFRGDTFLYLLKFCPQLTLLGVDIWQSARRIPWEPHVRKESAQYGDRAVIMKMSTFEASKHVPDNSLDFVFIDADHSLPAVTQDIEAWSPKVKPEGWIMGHDYYFARHPGVAEAVDRFFPEVQEFSDKVWACPKAKSPFAC